MQIEIHFKFYIPQLKDTFFSHPHFSYFSIHNIFKMFNLIIEFI